MHNEGIETRSSRRIPYRALSLVVSGVLLALGIAVVYQRVNWREIGAIWSQLDPKLFALACVLYWLQYPLNSVRLHRVILWTTGRSESEAPPLWFSCKLTCSAGFVAAAAPIGLASEAAKTTALRRVGKLPQTEPAPRA